MTIVNVKKPYGNFKIKVSTQMVKIIDLMLSQCWEYIQSIIFAINEAQLP